MGFLKTALFGAAVYGAYKYATKKNVNGKSIVDDIKEKAPEWKKKIVDIKGDVESELHDQKAY